MELFKLKELKQSKITEKAEKTSKVMIRDECRRKLPFGNLKTRNGTAIVLSYYGNNVEVFELMQTTSHLSRAFIINANGLKGFL